MFKLDHIAFIGIQAEAWCNISLYINLCLKFLIERIHKLVNYWDFVNFQDEKLFFMLENLFVINMYFDNFFLFSQLDKVQ